MASVILAMRGCRIIYLGSDTPLDQIATAVRERATEAVALSISVTVPRSQAGKAVTALRETLPRRAAPRRAALWIGGAGAPKPPKGVERFESLRALDAGVIAWAGSG